MKRFLSLIILSVFALQTPSVAMAMKPEQTPEEFWTEQAKLLEEYKFRTNMAERAPDKSPGTQEQFGIKNPRPSEVSNDEPAAKSRRKK